MAEPTKQGDDNKNPAPPAGGEGAPAKSGDNPAPAPQQPNDPKKRSKLEQKKVTAARLMREIKDESGQDFNPTEVVDDDDQPVTKGELRRQRAEESKRDAYKLAEAIPDDEVREAVKSALDNDIVLSGDAQEDFRKAALLVSSERNVQIAQIAAGRRPAARRPSGGGAPAKEEEEVVPTEDEQKLASMAGKKTPQEVKDFVKKSRDRSKAGMTGSIAKRV